MLIGRAKEQKTLLSLLDNSESQFCVVYGRRRVGKTYLIRETFHYKFAFQHTGVARGNYREQLRAFRDSLRMSGLQKCNIPKNWSDAFGMLKELIMQAPAGKKVIFIDELPWMDTPKSNMIGALEHFWNGWVTSRAEKDIVLIVCGSASSWVSKNLLRDKGGLRGRFTEKIKLMPFTLTECEQYARAAGLVMERKDIFEMYMILGGIPYYWSFLHRGNSISQNIDELFFVEDAKLKDEFQALYHTLFKRPDNYLKVIEALTKRRSGLTREEILRSTKLEDGGTFSQVLDELEQCGFVRRYVAFNKEGNGALFQLIDNYTLFYYYCIRKNAFSDEQYWSHTCLSNEHNAWKGLAFERVCLQHVAQIKHALGIGGIVSNVCSWSGKGAQIDMVIARGDNVINICEMKFCNGEYAIDKKYAEDLDRKMITFREETGTRSALHLTMVTTYGVSHNQYWNKVQSEVLMDDLFNQ
ncbi:MAG: ATP-binding protein [Prevotellaceae bacterium]|nr:ATP-binding protein [Prevotellaceae bacterium]